MPYTATERISLLEGLLKESKREHCTCVSPWNSCDKVIDPLNDCSCGADDWNRRVEEALYGKQESMLDEEVVCEQ